MTQETGCDVLIIGGGVVGCAIFWALAHYPVRVVLCEAASDVGQGISRANTAIAHTGFDAPPGTLEARLVTSAHRRMSKLCSQFGVGYYPYGALMVALDEEDCQRLDMYQQKAAANGIAVERLSAATLRSRWPFLNPETQEGLFIPGEASVDSFALTIAYAQAAVCAGGILLLEEAVTAIDPRANDIAVITTRRTIAARYVVNAAGLHADQIAQMVGDDSFAIYPRKGQLLVIDSAEAPPINIILLPTPSPTTKGILITPAAHGNLLLGPTAEDGDDRDDWSTTEPGLTTVLAGIQRLVPSLQVESPITQYAGLRSVGLERVNGTYTPASDYLIRPAAGCPQLLHVAGIRSTGLSASPAIADYVIELLLAQGLELSLRRAMPPSPPALRVAGADETTLVELATRDYDYTQMVCPCALVTAGEVRAAIHSPVPAHTLDALKRRLWVMTGPCQGSLCLAPLISLLSSELGLEPTQIRKHAPGSEMLTGPCRHTPQRLDPVPSAALASLLYDVVVVGAGPAGHAAALAARQQGATVALVDRATQPGGALAALGLGEATIWVSTLTQAGITCAFRTTLLRVNSGLEPVQKIAGRAPTPGESGGVGPAAASTDFSDRLLTLDLLGVNGFQRVQAKALILATGGREITRGNLILPGTRPAGVLTAGTAMRLLAATGCAPGRRAVLCGEGRWSSLTAEHLAQAGLIIQAHLPSVSRIEGRSRLEAVIGPTGKRIACDVLVLTTATVPWRPAIGPTDYLQGLFMTGSAAAGELDARESAHAGAQTGQVAAQWALSSKAAKLLLKWRLLE